MCIVLVASEIRGHNSVYKRSTDVCIQNFIITINSRAWMVVFEGTVSSCWDIREGQLVEQPFLVLQPWEKSHQVQATLG